MRVLFVVFMWTLNIIATKTTVLRACENLNFDDDIWGRTSNTNWGLNYQETQKNLHVSSNKTNLDCRYDSLCLCMCFFLMDAFPFFLVKSPKSHATHLFLTKRFHVFWWLSCSFVLHSQLKSKKICLFNIRLLAYHLHQCNTSLFPPFGCVSYLARQLQPWKTLNAWGPSHSKMG